MLALAIETSGDVAGLALATEEGLVSELDFSHRMDLLRRLMPNVDGLLGDAGRSPHDLDAVVISLGPGSFTGLRIGMAAAKSVAHVLGKPIVGVPTMDVLAHGASAARPKSIATLIHARPQEVFWAIYRCDAGRPVRLAEDRVSPVQDVMREAKRQSKIVFCGNGAERNREALEAEFGPSCVLDERFHTPRAAVLASLGIERLMRGESDDVFGLAPRYVRRPTPVVRIEASNPRD
jgi:tRNA threonylcarbamoyladenosine biosynthesis protein TsaB